MPKKTPTPIELPKPIDTDTYEGRVVSYSELDTYRQCPLKHMLAYNERWTRPTEEGSPLSKGSLWHLVMEAHYESLLADDRAGNPRSLARAGDAVYPILFDQYGRQNSDQELVDWMYDGYVEAYGTDDDWEILAVEYKLAEELPTQSGTQIAIKGKLDLIVRSRTTGMVWVVDHKSGANLPGQFDLDIDDQFSIYVWLLQYRGLRVLGSIHNAARTTRNQADFPEYVGKSKPQTLEQRFRRTPMNRSERELENVIHDATAVAETIVDPNARLFSSPDPRQCSWKCDFSEVHLAARKGRNLHAALAESGFVQNFERH